MKNKTQYKQENGNRANALLATAFVGRGSPTINTVCEEKHSRGETVGATQLSTGTVTRTKAENLEAIVYNASEVFAVLNYPSYFITTGTVTV